MREPAGHTLWLYGPGVCPFHLRVVRSDRPLSPALKQAGYSGPVPRSSQMVVGEAGIEPAQPQWRLGYSQSPLANRGFSHDPPPRTSIR